MSKKLLLILFVTGLLHTAAKAQLNCGQNRYLDSIFTVTKTWNDIKYGEAREYNNCDTIDLIMDIYEPTADTAQKRPLAIFAHGGSFLIGDEEQDVPPYCKALTKRGYVTASIEYRVGWTATGNPDQDSVNVTEAAYRAIHDGRAAVRYFKEYADSFNIDTNYIFFGGFSAGGVMAVNIGYVNTYPEIPSYVDTTACWASGGTVEGNNGNPGHISTDLAGVISLAGGLNSLSAIDPGEPPLLSIHGTDDDVVPCNCDKSQPIPGFYLTTLCGGCVMDPRAEQEGLCHTALLWQGAGHGDILADSLEAVNIDTMVNFLHPLVCDTGCTVTQTPGAITQNNTSPGELSVYPNPVEQTLYIEIPNGTPNAQLQVYNNMGQLVRSVNEVRGATVSLSMQPLAAGIYYIRVQNDKKVYSQKVVVH